MERRAATKGNHGAGGDITAALNGMDARRIGHVFFDDFSHARRRPKILESQWIADGFLQRCLGVRLHQA